MVARRQLLDAAGGEAGEVVRGALERGERGPRGLVRERDGDLGAAGERLEEAPLRAGEILEAVGEDGAAVPGGEIAREPVGGERGARAARSARPELVELGAVGRVQERERAVELLRVDEAVLELGDRLGERVGEAGVRAEAPRPFSEAPATTRRTSRRRCASVATGARVGVRRGRGRGRGRRTS